MLLQISALTIHRVQSIVDCSGVTFLKSLKMSYVVGWISIQIAQFHRDAYTDFTLKTVHCGRCCRQVLSCPQTCVAVEIAVAAAQSELLQQPVKFLNKDFI